MRECDDREGKVVMERSTHAAGLRHRRGRARVFRASHWWRDTPPPVPTLSPKLAARLAKPKRARKRRTMARVEAAAQPVVHRLSGWQRNQWARAGYPSARVGRFAAMVHR